VRRAIIAMWLVTMSTLATQPPFHDRRAMADFMVADGFHYGRRLLATATDELRQMVDRFQQQLDAMNHDALERAYEQPEGIQQREVMKYLYQYCPLHDGR
jgi:hypothetical protein